MKALILNCTLKPSPATSNTEALANEVIIITSPTWLGHPSSLAQPVLERMDAMISDTETDEGHGWSAATGRTAASVLVAAAQSFKVTPIPASAYKAGS